MTMNQQQEDYALDWDQEGVAEGAREQIVLPAGEYQFTVEKFERGRYEPKPGAKLPPAPKAIITLRIDSDQGPVYVIENIILTKSMQWKRDTFFIAIGQAVEGQPYRPNWMQIVGTRGTCELEVNKYTDNNGNPRENNRVKSFKEPANAPQQNYGQAQQSYQAPPQQQNYQASQQPQQSGNFTPGAF